MHLALHSLSMSSEVTVGGIGTSAFATTSLHSFIHGAFPNAVLLEEHQVCTLLCEAILSTVS